VTEDCVAEVADGPEAVVSPEEVDNVVAGPEVADDDDAPEVTSDDNVVEPTWDAVPAIVVIGGSEVVASPEVVADEVAGPETVADDVAPEVTSDDSVVELTWDAVPGVVVIWTKMLAVVEVGNVPVAVVAGVVVIVSTSRRERTFLPSFSAPSLLPESWFGTLRTFLLYASLTGTMSLP